MKCQRANVGSSRPFCCPSFSRKSCFEADFRAHTKWAPFHWTDLYAPYYIKCWMKKGRASLPPSHPPPNVKVTNYNTQVLFPVLWLAALFIPSCFLCLAQSLVSSQCGHFPMYQLRLSKQQSLGKFALVQDYVNYHGIITSLKQAEINYLWWNECKMRK